LFATKSEIGKVGNLDEGFVNNSEIVIEKFPKTRKLPSSRRNSDTMAKSIGKNELTR
jgi:hypothetical protein